MFQLWFHDKFFDDLSCYCDNTWRSYPKSIASPTEGIINLVNHFNSSIGLNPNPRFGISKPLYTKHNFFPFVCRFRFFYRSLAKTEDQNALKFLREAISQKFTHKDQEKGILGVIVLDKGFQGTILLPY